ncbi:protein toll-like [Zeugodacus cucurbitae]|uniref:protein toll-like n=1 Tax=Zeugodacus cucurbitae TaxID=28588 RepID=UPI0023D8E3F2|nr:protein toll-like [Zeugodacus cucurbitae]XP_054087359.1 protein toll-like [Zeugodacus cucurbitae]
MFHQRTQKKNLLLQLLLCLLYADFVYTNFPTTKQSLLMKLKPKPNGPENAFKSCYQNKCQCKKEVINCYLSDRNGAVTLTISWDVGKDKITLNCEGATENIDSLLSPVTHEFEYADTYYELTDCQQLPAMLRRPNITYVGHVSFTVDVTVPEQLFSHTNGLLRLVFNVTTSNRELGVPTQLFQPLTELRELQLIVVSDAPVVSLPLELIHSLKTIKILSLYVYHSTTGYYERLNSQHTSLRNLTSAHFRECQGLRSLLLDANQLGMLNPTVFNTLHELNHLSLSLNGLQILPEDLFVAQHKLVILDLSMNALTSLPSRLFEHTQLLWKLQLSNNRFHTPTNIIAAVRSLHYLHQLDLETNAFTSICGTGIYSNRTLLTRRDIRDPATVPAFADYVTIEQGTHNERKLNITVINLSRNRITHFNLDWISGVDGLACPYEVDLSHNNIQNIYAARRPSSATGKCEHTLKLSHNRLHCDCKLAWLYSSDFLSKDVDWSCATPAPLARKSLRQLQRNQICAWAPSFCPAACECSYDTPALVVNCTNARLESITQLPHPAQFSLNSSALYIEHNNFYELPTNITLGYPEVTHIYAAHNRLVALQPTHLPRNVTLLDVRDNQLERLSVGFLRAYLNESATLQALYLGDNPWLCDCDSEELLRTVRLQRARIPDADRLMCANFANVTLLDARFEEICKTPFLYTSLVAPLVGMFSTSVVILSLVALFYKYKLSVKIWLFAHNMFLCCIKEYELDKHKTFDAFISYAHQDQEFVNTVLLPGLEQGRTRFRICTHERNWLAGVYIPEQIMESVEQSCRTIIVLSQHFIESDWGRMEFRTAHQCALNEGRARIIIIKYGELTDTTRLDNELLAYMKLNTYLEWGDTRFWPKLRYALPHKFGVVRKSGMLDVSRKIYVQKDLELSELHM